MTTTAPRPLQPGDRAPGFSLPAINREGAVSLEEYRGKQPVLVGLFRGLSCPFCRRHLVQLSATQEKLKPTGVETLGVVNTTLDRARLYFKYRPTRIPLAADPEATTHRAYGVPEFQVADTTQWPYRVTLEELGSVRMNPTGELPAPLSPLEIGAELNRRDGFEMTQADEQIYAAHGGLLNGLFLLDREGIVRWAHIEAQDRISDFGKAVPEAEILAAARALPR